jgi:transposase-like protein
MIVHPLVLPDTPLDVAQLEEAVRAWGREAQQRAFTAAWVAQAALRPPVPCPSCQATDLSPAGTKPRKIETTFGPVRLPRQRRRCRGCGRHFQPDDAVLVPAVGAGQGTPALRELAALAGAGWPYRSAARVLGRLRGSPVAPETVRQAVAQTGAAVAAQHAAEAEAACRPPAGAPDTTRPRPAQVVLELDGAWVRSHDNAEGMEAKVGVVHAGSERVGRTRTRLRERRYAATCRGVAALGPLVTAAVEQRNGYEAREQTLLGDGAAWIWKLGTTVLAEAAPVLDRWHLADARGRALRQAVPDEAEREVWTERIEAALGKGDVPGAVAVLAELAQEVAAPAVPEFIAFLTEQAGRIPDYAARRAAGQPIGSGGVEKGVDVVVNRRCKGRRGMKWWRDRADEVLALRVAELNGEWDQRLPLALTLGR